MISFSPDNKHFVVGLWDAGQSARVIVFGIESEPNSELMKWTINNLVQEIFLG